MNHTHAVQCYPCPAGYYCVLQGQSEICPTGYYCPAGTGLDWKACPRGTYSDVAGIYQESQCKPCPPGQYCDGEHLSTPTGKSVQVITQLKGFLSYFYHYNRVCKSI